MKIGGGFKKIKLIKPQTTSIEPKTTKAAAITSQTVPTITTTAMNNSATPKPVQSNNISTTSTVSNVVAKPETMTNNNSSNSITTQTTANMTVSATTTTFAGITIDIYFVIGETLIFLFCPFFSSILPFFIFSVFVCIWGDAYLIKEAILQFFRSSRIF